MTHHTPIRERRRQHQEVVHTEPVRRHDRLLNGQELPRVLAELPIRRIDQLGLSPDPALPCLAFGGGERAVPYVACCERDEVGRDRYRLH